MRASIGVPVAGHPSLTLPSVSSSMLLLHWPLVTSSGGPTAGQPSLTMPSPSSSLLLAHCAPVSGAEAFPIFTFSGPMFASSVVLSAVCAETSRCTDVSEGAVSMKSCGVPLVLGSSPGVVTTCGSWMPNVRLTIADASIPMLPVPLTPTMPPSDGRSTLSGTFSG